MKIELQRYADAPEVVTERHAAAMTLVRSWAVEQAVRAGKGETVREADSIMRKLLEDRYY